jgi:hypothetical protein
MTRRTPLALLTLSLTAVAGATVAIAAAAPATAGPTTVLRTALTGEAEVPKPGDPDGKGNGVVRVDRSSNEICVVITTHGTEPLLAGHIHEKAEGSEVGGVVVPLTQVSETKFKGCTINRDVAAGLLSMPSDYYLNVHNAPFPGGALRGDLG